MTLPVSTASATSNGTGTSVAVSKPSGKWSSGNWLIASCVVYPKATWTAPTGWTLVKTESDSSAVLTLSVYSLDLTSAGASSYTFTNAGGANATVDIAEYSSVSGVDVSAVGTGPSSPATWTAVTTGHASEPVLLIFACQQYDAQTTPSGYTNEVDTNESGFAYNAIFDTTQTTAGSTGSPSTTMQFGGCPWCTVTLGLTPSGGGGSTAYPFRRKNQTYRRL